MKPKNSKFIISLPLKLVAVLIFSVFIFISCNKNDINPNTAINKTIDFQGEKLLLSSEITESDVQNYLNYSVDTYNKNFAIIWI